MMVMGDIVTGCDVLVIGGGPGGYVAAIRASQLGKDVILVEKEELGGVCTNHGCIPSKALIHVANFIHDINSASIVKASVEFDFRKIQEWNKGVVKRLRDGIAYLCKKYGVEVIKGKAYLESSDKARITLDNGNISTIQFNNAIIATGSSPSEYPGFAFDGELIISSKEALSLTKIPEDMVIVGAGYISIELGTMFAKLGTKVKIIQRSSRILTKIDAEIVEVVAKKMKQLGIEIYLNSRLEAVHKKDGKGIVMVRRDEQTIQLTADKILVAIGVKPNSNNLGLENTRVELNDKGFIKVDQKQRTTDPKIYAVGDITGAPFLAHKAFREAKVAAEVIAGLPSAFDNRAIPLVIFSDPEIASTGMDEKTAKQKGFEVIKGIFPYKALGRALTMDTPEGLVKVIANKENYEILGIHIVGVDAASLISEATLSIEMVALLEDVASTIHPHPTFPEAISEAAELALGKAIHI